MSRKKGFKHSKETKLKMSLSATGKNNSMFGKKKELNPFYGKKHSNESKMKISLANSGKRWTTEQKERHSKMKQKTSSGENNPMRRIENRIKLSKKLKGRIRTKEHCKKLSKTHKEKYKNEGNPYLIKGKEGLSEESLKLRINKRIKTIKESGSLSGENNPNWLGGKSFEPYDKKFTKKFKRDIRKRDNQICMMCGMHREKLNRALNVHHINYDKELSIPQNCISLCDSCHTKTNFNRELWVTFFQNILYKNYGYVYEKNKPIIEFNY